MKNSKLLELAVSYLEDRNNNIASYDVVIEHDEVYPELGFQVYLYAYDEHNQYVDDVAVKHYKQEASAQKFVYSSYATLAKLEEEKVK